MAHARNLLYFGIYRYSKQLLHRILTNATACAQINQLQQTQPTASVPRQKEILGKALHWSFLLNCLAHAANFRLLVNNHARARVFKFACATKYSHLPCHSCHTRARVFKFVFVTKCSHLRKPNTLFLLGKVVAARF